VKHLVLFCAAIMPLVLTAACGQKGALYLPPRNGTVVTRPAGTGSNNPPSPPPSTEPGQPDNKKKNKDDKDNSQPQN
jgi:predicted small lipoprotein YifL